MRQPTSIPYPVSDFLDWSRSNQLVIAPKFQRRSIWIPKAKSYLIDTILRGMPIPPIFIRLTVNPTTQRATREIVDGQQRLRAVLEFIDGQFPILKAHNVEYGGHYFNKLPEETRREFLGYKFVCHVLEDVSDSDVLDIFARINTYTIRLNAQELRNAEYFGVFKQTVYDLGFRHYAFWRNTRILNDADLARMKEAELASELLVTMLSGIRQTKDKDLREFYSKFDDEFPEAKRYMNEFDETINTVGELAADGLPSHFRRVPLFYSLFVAIYDARYGLPNSAEERIRFTQPVVARIGRALAKLESALVAESPPKPFARFVDASQRRTADPGTRRLRHEVILREIHRELAK